jgi:hypothetical protein
LLKTRPPYLRIGSKKVVIPKIDIWAHLMAMLVSLFIKKPFKFGIWENSVF